MTNERLTMRKIREILRLSWNCKLSCRQIATSCSISRSTVTDYIYRAQAARLSWPLPDDYDDAVLETLLFPPQQNSGPERPLPNFTEIHEKLQQKGMTLALLWEKYKWEHNDGYQYSQYCVLYRQWSKTVDPVYSPCDLVELRLGSQATFEHIREIYSVDTVCACEC